MRPRVAGSLASLAILVAACATTPPDTELAEAARVVVTPTTQRYLDEVGSVARLVIVGGDGLEPGSADWRKAAVNNALATDYYRNRESRHYPSRQQADAQPVESSWPRGLPRRCIALSGGGLRAAAYAMGSLDALQTLRQLDGVDVIASSSGGSYVNYWLTLALAQGRSLDDVFSGPTSPALSPIRREPDALAKAWWIPAAALSTADWALTALAFATGNGFGLPMTQQTQYGKFGTLPAGKLYASALHHLLTTEPESPQLTLEEIQRRLEGSSAPLPVITTTVRFGSARKCDTTSAEGIAETRGQDLSAAVFELTPWRVGSDGMGYAPSPKDLKFVAAVAASAAATDDPNARRCPFLSVANMRLGMANDEYKPLPNVFPPPPLQGPTMGPYSIALIDSTFSDNLGAYALVRRLCEEILIIDAEHDPGLIFESYGNLKQHLAKQGLELTVPDADAIAAQNRVDCATPSAVCQCAHGVCLINARETCLRHGAANDCIKSNSLPRPVFTGAIRGIPFVDDSSEEPRALDIKVTYLKLSLDESRIDSYPSNVRDRYLAQASRRAESSQLCTGEGMQELCSYPHESTYDQDFRNGKFEAYWELGRCNVQRFMSSTDVPAACADDAWPPVPSKP